MIKQLMTEDHRKCDEPFGIIEEKVGLGKFEEIVPLFTEWKKRNLNHFSLEENTLFPAAEKALGHRIPPIAVMLSEHAQIKAILEEMEEAFKRKDKKEFLGLADTCMIMIQQHNMKEEQILYGLIENVVPLTETLKKEIDEILL